MWIDRRRQQYRVYWRTANKRDYLPFASREDAETFLEVAREIGLDAAREALAVPRVPSAATTASPSTTGADLTPSMEVGPTTLTAAALTPRQGMPRLAAGLTLPVPAGVTTAWLAEQYVEHGNQGNPQTRDDYRRDIRRYVLPYFVDHQGDSLDIGLVCTYDLPTAEGEQPWSLPTVTGWGPGWPSGPSTGGTAPPSPGPSSARRRNATSRGCSPRSSPSR
ncbi:hypothetical protein [Jannaschia sp. R86511]|uniref:hypothetical protein n=1 Tax=Jannaschia sp. R86511 TaxID=3093853 RepID=UPI0036D25BE2